VRVTYLYLRSRQVERAVALLLALSTATFLWRRLSDGNPLNSDLMITGLPIAAAVIIGASTGSPFRDVEDAASRWLPALRVPHLIGLVLVASSALALTTAAWQVSDMQWALVRNVVLFTGLGLLGARVLGTGLGWLLPVAYGFLTFMAVLLNSGQSGHQLRWAKSGVRWAWTLHAGKEHEATIVASVALLVGLGIVVVWGARDSLAETM
jgi:hypothetical protein